MPGIAWEKAEARQLVGALIRWHLWCDRKSDAGSQRHAAEIAAFMAALQRHRRGHGIVRVGRVRYRHVEGHHPRPVGNQSAEHEQHGRGHERATEEGDGIRRQANHQNHDR